MDKKLLTFCKSKNIKVVSYSTAMETLKTFSTEISKTFNMDISKIFKSITEERDSFYLDVPGCTPVIFVNEKLSDKEKNTAVGHTIDYILLNRFEVGVK